MKLTQEKRIEHRVVVNPETQRAVGILTAFDMVQYMAVIAAGSPGSGSADAKQSSTSIHHNAYSPKGGIQRCLLQLRYRKRNGRARFGK